MKSVIPIPLVALTALFTLFSGSQVSENAIGHALVANELVAATASGQTALMQTVSSATIANENEPKYVYYNDIFFDKQWGFTALGADTILPSLETSSDILVAVLDTGVDPRQEDLAGKIAAEANFTESANPYDVNGHGTAVAGIIAATAHNGLGIVGLAPRARLLNVKVADDRGTTRASDVAKGVRWAADQGADVINISLEFNEMATDLAQAIDYAWQCGAVIVAPASNTNSQIKVYPAGYNNVVSVVALRPDGTIGPMSGYGDWVEVAAPGFDIFSTLPGDSYGYRSGTSFAAAYVSGLAAVLCDYVTDINGDGRVNDEVVAAIKQGCRTSVTDSIGRMDAAASLRFATQAADLMQ